MASTLKGLFSAFVPSASSKLVEKARSIRQLHEPALKLFTQASMVQEGQPLQRLAELDQKELRTHSLLEKVAPRASYNPSLQLLGQIHADSLAKGTMIESLTAADGARAWAALLPTVEGVAIPEEVKKAISQIGKSAAQLAALKDVTPFSKEVARTVFNLKVGDSYLLQGGKRPMQALFEFIKVGDNSYNIFVYLQGQGTRFRESLSDETGKEWEKSILYFEGVPGDSHLFFGKEEENIKSDFFQAIVESTQTAKEADFMMLHLLAHLLQYRKESGDFASERETLTDGWTFLKPYLILKLGRENYKKMNLEIRLNTLIQGYQQLPKEHKESETVRIILRRGAQLLLKNLASAHKQLTPEFTLAARATAVDLLARLDEIEKALDKSRKENLSPLQIPPPDEEKVKAGYQALVAEAKKEDKGPTYSRREVSLLTPKPRLIKIAHPRELSSRLAELVNGYDKREQSPKIWAAEIEYFVTHLPVTNDFWVQLQPAESAGLLKNLSKLLSVYNETRSSDRKAYTACERNTVYTLFAAIHRLVVEVEPKLKKYPLFFPAIYETHDNYQIYTSYAEYQRFEELRAYFKKYQGAEDSDPLFNLNRLIYGNSSRTREYSLIAYMMELIDSSYRDELTAKKLNYLFNANKKNYETSLTEEKVEKLPEGVKKAILATDLVRRFGNEKEDSSPLLPLAYLFRAAVRAHHASGFHDTGLKAEISLQGEKGGVFQECSFYFNFKREKPYSSYSDRLETEDSSALHPSGLSGTGQHYSRSFFEHPSATRLRAEDSAKKEAEALSKFHPTNELKSSVESAKLPHLFSASSEPSLFPYKLLAHYSSRLDLFENLVEQTLFEVALFRPLQIIPTPLDKSKKSQEMDYILTFPLAEELRQKSFQEQMALFIQEGIDRFYYRQPNQKPKVLAVTFFLRLAARLADFPGGDHRDLGIDAIERMLAMPTLTQEERSLISLHLVLAYRKLGRELSQTEVEKVFSAWVFYKNSPLPAASKNPLLELEAESLIYEASLSLPEEQNETLHRELLRSTLLQLGIQLSDTYTVTLKEPHLIEGRHGDDFWLVNLITGAVQTTDGPLRYVSSSYTSDKVGWSYIFGPDFAPTFFEASTFTYFSHPQLGTLRKTGSYSNLKLERSIDGEWCTLVPRERALKSLPSFLCQDMTHWITKNSELLICDRKSGAITAIFDKGIILGKSGQRFLPFASGTALDSFESAEQIHWTVAEDGKRRLHLWRYHSQAGTPLSFDLEGDALVYTMNRKFQLSAEQRPALIGTKNGALLLVHRESGAKKVIVQLRPLAGQAPLSSQHAFDLPPFDLTGENHLEFVEYDLKGGKLVPANQEATLHLSYLYLSQRQYIEALRALKQIDFREPLSPTSRKVITWLIQTKDTSPEAAAVALHAALFVIKANQRVGKAVDELSKLNEIRATYRRYEHHLPEELLLNGADRSLAGIKESGKRMKMRYPDLGSFRPFPEQPYSEFPEVGGTSYDNARKSLQGRDEELKQVIKDNIAYSLPFLEEPKSGPLSLDDPIPLLKDWDKEFERRFFRTAYTVAKSGSELERKRLAFRLQLVALDKDSSVLDGEKMPPSWRYLQLALQTRHVPELPPAKDDLAKLTFAHYFQGFDYPGKRSVPRPEYSDDKLSTPVRAILSPAIPAKKLEDSTLPLKLLPLSMEAIDQGATAGWFSRHFEEAEKSKNPPVAPPACPDKDSLEEDEKPFFDYLQQEFAKFDKDFQKGAELNAERRVYRVKDVEGLSGGLRAEVELVEKQRVDLEVSLLELVNKHDPTDVQKGLLIEAKLRQELSLKRLTDLFLRGDADAFAKANPYLRNEALIQELAQAYGLGAYPNLVIEYLYNQMGLFMALTVQKARLERALKYSQQLEGTSLQGAAREAQVQKLAAELQPVRDVYPLQESPLFLVYEYLSGLSIRSEQAPLIQKMLEKDKGGHYISRVVQAYLGFGKTTLLATILLKYAASKGRLALFITLASQYSSVSYNLRKMLRDCFEVELEEFDVSREQLTRSPATCHDIMGRLQKCMHAGDIVLEKGESLLTIAMTFIVLISEAAQEVKEPQALMEKINLIKEILFTHRKKGDAIFDEVDLLLHVLFEMNFPMGDKKYLSPERIEVGRELFLLLISEKVALDEHTTINLAKEIGIRQNRQNLMSPQLLKTTIPKVVAYNFVRTMVSLKLSVEWQASFERYLNGTMNLECQRLLDKPDAARLASLNAVDRRDFEFLKYLRQLRNSAIPAEQEATHQIALIKHMLQVVLPSNLKQIGKRDYGRGGALPGEVRPYLAVDTPSENLYGYQWEWLGIHFLTALQCGVSEEQFRHVAKIYEAHAKLQVKVAFEETLQATEFKEMTGIGLHELDDPLKVEQALRHLKSNVDALLQMEADTAAEYVGYYPKRISAPRSALMGLLSTVRAMGGTLPNLPCYPKALRENCESALGTEGKYAERALTRVATREKGKSYVHVTHSEEVDQILKEVLTDHPEKGRVRALLDPGARFKNSTNLQVAQAIRAELNLHVLFFMRNPQKQEKTPDTLTLLRADSDNLETIGGTRLEDIQKMGIDLGEYFVFYDERHTLGTDIPLPSDAIFLKTADEELLRDVSFQADGRAREYFLQQNVETILPDYLLPILDRLVSQPEKDEELKRLRASLVLTIKNQALLLPDYFYRASKHEVDEVFRELFWQEFLIEGRLSHDYIRQRFPAHEKTLVIEQEDLPYDQFGSLEVPVDAAKSLDSYQKRKADQFPKEHEKRKGVDGVVNKSWQVVLAAQKSPYLVGQVLEKESAVGIHVDVLVDVASEVRQNVDQNVEEEILSEAKEYDQVRYQNIALERSWSDAQIEALFQGNVDDLHPLSRYLGPHHYLYRRDYSSVFTSKVLVTDSWAYSTDTPLPAFHHMQRPLDQLLVVKRADGYQSIALSQYEASQFKRYLSAHPQQGVWLVHADGRLLHDNPLAPLPKNGEIESALVEANVFNGRIDYLEAHEEAALAWLHQDQKAMEIKIHFIKLKIANQPFQKRLFFKSDLFVDSSVKENQRQHRWNLIAAEMDALTPAQIQAQRDPLQLRRYPPKQLNMLTVEQVPLLNLGQIPYLKRADLIQAIPQKFASKMKPFQMEFIKEEQVTWFQELAQIQKIPSRFLTMMTDVQLARISSRQVAEIVDPALIDRLAAVDTSLLGNLTGEQVAEGIVDEKCFKYLIRKEAIESVPVSSLHHIPPALRKRFLTSTQVEQLDPETQRPLIHELTSQQVGWLQTEAQLREVQPDHIPGITDKDLLARIGKSRPELLASVTQKQVIDKLVTEEMVPHLRNAATIGALPVAWLPRVGVALRQQALSKTQVQQITYREYPQLFRELTDAQMAWVYPNYIGAIDERELLIRFAKINPKAIESITAEQVKAGLVPEEFVPKLYIHWAMVQAFPNDWLHYVDKKVREQHLSKTQIETLDPAKHQQIIEELTPAQALWLKTPAQLQVPLPKPPAATPLMASVTQKQVIDKLVTEEMVPHLRNAATIGALPVAWLPRVGVALRQQALSKTQVQQITYREYPQLFRELTDAQMAWVYPNYIGAIDERELLIRFAKINPKAIESITAEQVKAGLVPEEFVPKLYIHWAMVQAFPNDWLHYVDKKVREQHLSKTQIETLDPAKHQQIIEELTPAQALWLKTPAQLQVPLPKPPAATPLTEEAPADAPPPERRSIVQIVLTVLGFLVAAALLTAGAFALMGGYWTQAPQFTVTIYHFFKSSVIISGAVLGGGALMLVGLIAFAIYQCKRNTKP